MRFSITAVGLLASIAATPLAARTTVSNYIEVDQSVYAPINNGGEVLANTTVAAGTDISVTGQNTQAQVAYRLQRDFGWQSGSPKQVTQSGIARIDTALIPHTLFLDAGGVVTRTNTDIRGNANFANQNDFRNLSQIYSGYVGPNLTAHSGQLNFNAGYRFGYTKVDTTTQSPLPAGQVTLDSFDHATSQSANASVGMRSGTLPLGWTVSGAWAQDDASQLDQRLVQKHVRGDVVLPLNPTLAAVGGVGYEQITASERNALTDPVTNLPVVDANGRYQTDPASARLPYYDFSGVYWDTGVIWRPTTHTNLEARIGRRFGSWSFTGSLTSALSPTSALRIGVYDEIDTFGSQVTSSVAGLPTSFVAVQNPFTGQYGGCVYAAQGSSGGCLSNALQSISSSVYRARGGTIVYSATHGPWNYGIAMGYSRRDFITPANGALSALSGVADQNAYAQAYLSRRLTPASQFDTNFYANWYKSGLAAAPTVTSYGASGTYSHSFGNHLSGAASLGIFAADESGVQEQISAEALLGMRYKF